MTKMEIKKLAQYIKATELVREYIMYFDESNADNFPLDVFNGINRDQILGVAVNLDKDYEMPICNKGEELSFFHYLYNYLK